MLGVNLVSSLPLSSVTVTSHPSLAHTRAFAIAISSLDRSHLTVSFSFIATIRYKATKSPNGSLVSRLAKERHREPGRHRDQSFPTHEQRRGIGPARDYEHVGRGHL